MIKTKRMQRAWKDISVLLVSPVSGYGGFNTSIHRVRALVSLGCTVEVIDSNIGESRLQRKIVRRIGNQLFQHGLPIRLHGGSALRSALVKRSSTRRWDLIWLEKALDIDHETIEAVRARCPSALIVGFSPDDMNARHNQSQQFLDAIAAYDYFLTTKSYNVPELKRMGCPDPRFIGNGYDPGAFRGVVPTEQEAAAFGGDVGFIGSYEADRWQSIRCLTSQGHLVRVWGWNWEKAQKYDGCHRNPILEYKPLYHEDFSKAVNSFKINLNFLRKINRDLQTTRSVEIPGCGGFMLAERTEEHRALFEEGLEAELFSCNEELSDKCKFYLRNHALREKIARAGYERCIRSGYSNAARINAVLAPIVLKKR